MRCIEIIEAVDPLTRAIQAELEQVKLFGAKTTYHILRAGQILNRKHAEMGQGRKRAAPTRTEWDEYLSEYFSLNYRNAYQMMQASREFPPDPQVSDYLDVSAAYVLSRPSAPIEAKDEAMVMIAKKKPVTHAIARELVKAHVHRLHRPRRRPAAASPG